MDRKRIIESLFDQKMIKILRLFINNPEKEYYLREAARLTKVSPATTFRIMKLMKENELITEQKTKHLKTYKINESTTGFLADLLEDKRAALREFTDFIKDIVGVDEVVQNGKEEPDKANVLVVGLGIDQQAIMNKVVELKEKYNYNIIYLVLEPLQYQQMLSMGLYKGTQKVLYRK